MTNSVNTVIQTVTNTVPQETLNSIMLDMLKGVKDVGGQVVHATTGAIGKSVDFVMEQAPLVVQEFLMWRFAEATIHLIFYVLALGLLVYVTHRVYKFFKNMDDDDAWMIAWIPLVGCVVAMFACTTQIKDDVMTMTKIKVAPRVYLIEYAAEQYKAVNIPSQRRNK